MTMQVSDLPLEQQLILRQAEIQIDQMNEGQLKEYCLFLIKNNLFRDNMYKHLLAKEWGLEVSLESLG